MSTKQREVYQTVVNDRVVAVATERHVSEQIQDAVFDTLQEAGIGFRAEAIEKNTSMYHVIGTRYVLGVR